MEKNASIMKSPLLCAIERTKRCRAGYVNETVECSNISLVKSGALAALFRRFPNTCRVLCSTISVTLPLLCAVAIVGCTGATPEILETRNTLIYRHDPQRSLTIEELSLFVRVSDDDGIDDIRNIYLIHDDLELYWTLSEHNWSRITYDEVEWIGSQSLRMADDTFMPRGRFRVEVVDRGGKRDQSYITIAQLLPIDQFSESLPTLQRQESSLYLQSQFVDNIVYQRLLGGDIEKLYQGAEGVVGVIGPEDNSESQNVAPDYWIYSSLDEEGATILYGPFKVR